MAFSGRNCASRHQRNYSPVAWTEYFDEAHDIQAEPSKSNADEDEEEDYFRVYLKNFQEPLAPAREPGKQLIHDEETTNLSAQDFQRYSQVPTLVALHGGGYSGLTWAQFARHIDQQCDCRILALDLRGHGDSKTKQDNKLDIETLVSDVIFIIQKVHQICGFPQPPKLVLIGHSMGGAIAIKCASKCEESLPSLVGLVVIDVVEGTAKDALPQMMSVINTRPTKFPTLSNAIEWSVRSGMAKNSEAARVSMPGNLVSIETGHLAVHDIISPSSTSPPPSPQVEDNDNNLNQILKRHKFEVDAERLVNQTSLQLSLNRPLPRLPAFEPVRVAALKANSLTEMPPPDDPRFAAKSGTILEEQPSAAKCQKIDDATKKSDTNIAVVRPLPVPSNEQQTNESAYKRSQSGGASGGYTWRTNLAITQPFWSGWFEGLSKQLLDAPVQGKFLLLAGIDRLDKTLTIGQMQGKFMMKVLPKCGHAVHEDVPEQVALAIGDFLVRNKFTKTR